MAEELSFIPTRAAALKQCAKHPFQAVVFEAHKSKPKKTVGKVDSSLPKNKELDMKNVRYEVFRFGMSGFDSKKKEECEIKQAIQLGAKPPKNIGQNYKELMNLRKQEAEQRLEERRLADIGKVKGMSSDKGKKWMYSKKQINKKPKGILQSYGKPGDNSFKKRKKTK